MSYLQRFLTDIRRMNDTYELPLVGPSGDVRYQRAWEFEDILKEEVEELGDLAHMEAEQMKVAMADLLADVIVYCASEALRWGIPIDKVLEVVMASNFSKLGADGKPIKDSRGKFLKGPNYWKPESKIEEILKEQDERC